MLSCLHIKKRFGSVVALEDASLDLHPGEVRALIGGNGSGKSTLAKILGGTVRHDAGEITLDGDKVSILSPSSSFTLGIGVTYQELSLLSNLTVAENLCLSYIPKRWLIKSDKKTMSDKSRRVLFHMGLDRLTDLPLRSLPLHQQYLLELAKAMLREPRFLILDEVTSALHHKQVEQVFEIIRTLTSKGCGILYISHRLHEVYNICDQITIMRNGAVIANIPVCDISTDEVVSLMSGTREENADSKQITAGYVLNQDQDKQQEVSQAFEKKPIFSVDELLIPSWNTTIKIDVFAGEILGIGGLQGQGQSELLRLLFGAIPHRTGVLVLKGNVINISSPKDAVRKGFGFLSGDREAEGIFAPRSVKENLIAVPGGFSTKEEDRNKPITPQTIVDQLGIVLGSIKQTIKSLSGGNQQKVVIGRWLGVKPTVLLADDPTKGVDVQARHDVHSILRDLSKKGSAIIIASSDDHELVEIADRIVVMNEGRIVGELTGGDRTVQQIVAASLPTLQDEGLEDGQTVSLS